MPDDAPHFDHAGRLVSPRFEDVYFSKDDGLAETQYVFVEANQLAERFAALSKGECFTISETGFGTGLNFLAAWQCFDQHAPAHARLAFVSVEGFPLDAQMMRRALSPWTELNPYAERLLTQWSPLWPGVHRFTFADGRVRLSLLVGEAAEALSSIDADVNAWFLDGFAPARNPAMWSDAVFREVARLSARDATLATYTAAGFVRRGLSQVGFEINKRPGFGRKREMIVGTRTGIQPADHARNKLNHATQPDEADAIVIGGSLAGTFVANALAEHGLRVTVFDRQRLMDGELPTLSPRIAVVQPKINAIGDKAGGLLRDGFAHVERRLQNDWPGDHRIAWQNCGTFHAAVDERSARRLRRFVDEFEPLGICRWVDAEQTKDELGLALGVGGVIIERAGILRPAGLCAALLDHPRVTVRDGVAVGRIEQDATRWRVGLDDGSEHAAHVVVVANALDARRFEQTRHLELRPVRGQATLLDTKRGGLEQISQLASLQRALFYGGYLTPALHGVQMLGASFVPGETDLAWRDREHATVCDQLARVLPDEADRLRGIDDPAGWVGLRATTPNHMPYTQQVAHGLYTSIGHGSYGVTSAAWAGEQVAALITQGVRQRG